MNIFRRLFSFTKRREPPKRSFSSSPRMSASMTSAALYAATVSSSAVTSATPEEVKEKRHHLKDGKGFTNPWDSWKPLSGPQIGKAIITRRLFGTANVPDTTPPTVPVIEPNFLPSRETESLRATWLGHACYFVEFPGGLRVLFDPVFSERCSPFSWLGPKRYTKVPCQIEQIPTIDAVVISHSHYDHLDYPTIMKIKTKHPNVHFFVPLRLKRWFNESKIKDGVTELDWWEEKDFTLSSTNSETTQVTNTSTGGQEKPASSISARIGCLPAQHTSARTAWDKDTTLWASWSVESGGKKVWFGGDTGYRSVPELPDGVDDYGPDQNFPRCPAFKQIGDLRGPFDLGLIPIAAYAPRWIFSAMHANPMDAVNMFKDTRCRRAMAIHWGTWVLTEEDVMEPPAHLKESLKRYDIAEEGVFDTCNIGESREFA